MTDERRFDLPGADTDEVDPTDEPRPESDPPDRRTPPDGDSREGHEPAVARGP